MKQYILKILQNSAKKVIEKHKPVIIWITWTVWKTTSTHFVYEFMQALYWNDVYMSAYDYNWEYGLPLTILHSKSPNKNIFWWIIVFIKWILLRFYKTYPKYLVLEYWIDHKWEMDGLLNIAKPDIWIILNIYKSHVMQFPDFKDYIDEKLKMAFNSKKIIYNIDDENLRTNLSSLEKNKAISYWIKNQDVDLTAKNIKSDVKKLTFDFCCKDVCHNLNFNLIWEFQAYNILPVFALGIELWVEIEKIIEIMANVNPQKWRWTLLEWVNNSIIIDWSYNWWFNSISAWIDYMNSLSAEYNKILFLWDMRELWEESKKMHYDLAEKIKSSEIDSIVLVWEEMKKYVYEKLVKHFWEQKVCWFLSSKQAWKKVKEFVQKSNRQSTIFVKWSQNTIFLEEWIKELLYDIRCTSKLCRQSPRWLKIKEDFFNNVL